MGVNFGASHDHCKLNATSKGHGTREDILDAAFALL